MCPPTFAAPLTCVPSSPTLLSTCGLLYLLQHLPVISHYLRYYLSLTSNNLFHHLPVPPISYSTIAFALPSLSLPTCPHQLLHHLTVSTNICCTTNLCSLIIYSAIYLCPHYLFIYPYPSITYSTVYHSPPLSVQLYTSVTQYPLHHLPVSSITYTITHLWPPISYHTTYLWPPYTCSYFWLSLL